MSGQHIGYIRVSTLDQHTEWQLDGIEAGKTFLDKASGQYPVTSPNPSDTNGGKYHIIFLS